MLCMTAVSGCARANQREPASDAGVDVRVAVRDGGVDVGTDASMCVDERVGERPCSVVWARGFDSTHSIRDVAVRADDSVGAVRGTSPSTTADLLAYDALGSLVGTEAPFVVDRLAAARRIPVGVRLGKRHVERWQCTRG
jgi:hypothetical protein